MGTFHFLPKFTSSICFCKKHIFRVAVTQWLQKMFSENPRKMRDQDQMAAWVMMVIGFRDLSGSGINQHSDCWKMDPLLSRFDVFPIENGDIPASYVSLPEVFFLKKFHPDHRGDGSILTHIFESHGLKPPTL